MTYTKEELEDLILTQKLSYEEIGRRNGVTGAAIKKAAKRLGIELPVRRKINESETFNKKEARYCRNCGKVLDSYQQYFCSKKCSGAYKSKGYIDRWKNGLETGVIKDGSVSDTIVNYLRLKYNNSCQKCGWNEINQWTHRVPLQVHHVDGDCTNNKEDNLELLCPNCHSLTDNFGSLNTGKSTRPK